MRFEPKNILLRDGTAATLRSPEVSDAQALLDYLKLTAGETDFLMRYPEEVTMTLEDEERYLSSAIDSPCELMLLCEVDGRLAGNCALSMTNRIKTRHRGTVAIALCREFWGKGIGSAMFEALIAVARQRGLAQLELKVIEGNDRARALYEKFGFRTTAVHPDAIRLKDGRQLCEYLMIKKLA